MNDLLTVEEIPANRPSGLNILKIPDEIKLLPQITEKSIRADTTDISRVGEEIRPQYADRKRGATAAPPVAESVVEGSAVVPLKIVHHVRELSLLDVEVPPVGEIVPEIVDDEFAGVG